MKNFIYCIFVLFCAVILQGGCDHSISKNRHELYKTNTVTVDGILGEAVDANVSGRLSNFISGADSPAIALFNEDKQETQNIRNWRGEHAGKWLYAASKTVMRNGDLNLKRNIIEVADFLMSRQEANGYLGNYAPPMRYYTPRDTILFTWDVWVNAYMLQGFTKVYELTGEQKYLDTACRILDLMCDAFMEKGFSLAHTGQHLGMVGAGSIDPVIDLYRHAPNPKYLKFISHCIEILETRPGLQLISKANLGMDVYYIGNGKIYELLRCFLGLAKLYQLTGDSQYIRACTHAWQNIRDFHLNPCGGPWGGAYQCNSECFNRPYCFSPYGVNETCETMDWQRLNIELLKITGEACYAEELEKTFYNALIGAQYSNGINWKSYSILNGTPNRSNEWSCCWSSGMSALEDIHEAVYTKTGNGIAVNIYTPSKINTQLKRGDEFTFVQDTDYPLSGTVAFTLFLSGNRKFSIDFRLPAWADRYDIKINGKTIIPDKKRGYLHVERVWSNGDNITLDFPVKLRFELKKHEYSDGGRYPGAYIGYCDHYCCFLKGPLVYATSHADNESNPNPLAVGSENPLSTLSAQSDREFSLKAGTQEYLFTPYYQLARNELINDYVIWLKAD